MRDKCKWRWVCCMFTYFVLHIRVWVHHHVSCIPHIIFSHNDLVSLNGLFTCGNSILTLTSIVASAVTVFVGSVLNYICWRNNKSMYIFNENIRYIQLDQNSYRALYWERIVRIKMLICLFSLFCSTNERQKVVKRYVGWGEFLS